MGTTLTGSVQMKDLEGKEVEVFSGDLIRVQTGTNGFVEGVLCGVIEGDHGSDGPWSYPYALCFHFGTVDYEDDMRVVVLEREAAVSPAANKEMNEFAHWGWGQRHSHSWKNGGLVRRTKKPKAVA